MHYYLPNNKTSRRKARLESLSLAAGYSTSAKDADIIGWPMIGADGESAGKAENPERDSDTECGDDRRS